MEQKKINQRSHLTALFTFILSIQFLVSFIHLSSIKSAVENRFVLGYSREWFFLLFLIAVLAVISIISNIPTLNMRIYSVLSQIASNKSFFGISIASAIMVSGLFVLASLSGKSIPPNLLPYYERFYPVIILALLVFAEFILTIILIHLKYDISFQSLIDRSSRLTLLVIAGILILFVILALTGLGNIPDPVSWRQPGSPLLTWQIAGALIAGTAVMVLERKIQISRYGNLLDWVFIIALLVIAFTTWMSLPLQTAYTAPLVRPPNYTVYPYSDALYYSLSAESVLNGDGFFGWSVVPRPLVMTAMVYIFALAKGEYAQVILLQTILLALIPVLLYLVGKELHSRSLGITIGLLSIFREVTAIQSTKYIPVSNSKLILSDLPAMMVFLLVTLAVIKWVKYKDNSAFHPFLVGGMLGVMMLVRTQSILLLPFFIIMLIIKYWKQHLKVILKYSLIMVIGVLITITPWVARNFILTNKLIFDDNRQTAMVVDRYQENQDAASTGNATQPKESSSIIQTIIKNPGFVVKFITNHFFRNVICTLLVIPPTLRGNDINVLLTQSNWWGISALSFSPLEMVWLTIIIILIAFGITRLVKRNLLIGLTPLFLYTGYNLSNSLARNSGGRYNLPIDWVGYTLFAAGILGLIAALLKNSGNEANNVDLESKQPSGNKGKKRMVLLALFFLLIGSSIPITEQLFSIGKADAEINIHPLSLITDEKVLNIAQNLLKEPGITLITGKAYYPRYYPAGEGEPGSSWVAYSPQDYDHLGFILMNGDGKMDVIYKINNKPKVFPNRSDVLVFGEFQESKLKGQLQSYFNVHLIIFPDTAPLLYYLASGK